MIFSYNQDLKHIVTPYSFILIEGKGDFDYQLRLLNFSSQEALLYPGSNVKMPLHQKAQMDRKMHHYLHLLSSTETTL